MRKVLYAQAVFGAEEKRAVADALDAGWLGNSKLVAEFERQMKTALQKKHALAVNSGSSANLLALLSSFLPKGGHVITPACTFNTTVAPIVQCGFVPVFIDVEPGKYVVSVKAVEAAITHETVAVMVPHLIGNCAEIAEIAELCERHSLFLIEDCCDTIGSKYDGKNVGSFGQWATMSFYASHHLTAAGGGGMVFTNLDRAMETMVKYRDWGRGDVFVSGATAAVEEDTARRFDCGIDGIPYDKKFLYHYLGYNFKMIEIQAAFALEQLKKLKNFNMTRKHNFNRLKFLFADLADHFILPSSFHFADPSWLAFPLTIRPESKLDRKELLTHLEANGIQTRMIFAGNITRHLPMKGVEHLVHGKLDGADLILKNGFLLGAHHGMTDEDCDHIYETVRAYVRK